MKGAKRRSVTVSPVPRDYQWAANFEQDGVDPVKLVEWITAWFPGEFPRPQASEIKDIQNLSDQWGRKSANLKKWSSEIVGLQRKVRTHRANRRRRRRHTEHAVSPLLGDIRGSFESAAAKIDTYRTVLEVRSRPQIRTSETEVCCMAHEAVFRITGKHHWTGLAQAFTFALEARNTPRSIVSNTLRERVLRNPENLSPSLKRQIPDLRKRR